MNVTIDLVNASGDRGVPTRKEFQSWSSAAHTQVAPQDADRELSIRLVDERESAYLNHTFRRREGPTNILSFPAPHASVPGQSALLGDLAICVPLLKREAREQGKRQRAHWAHLCVHGVLHLNGYDHESDEEAVRMEGLEVAI